jgi:hypothetical protein
MSFEVVPLIPHALKVGRMGFTVALGTIYLYPFGFNSTVVPYKY